EGQRVNSDGISVIKWSAWQTLNAPNAVPLPWALNLNDSRVHLADMDGDGLSDLVQVSPTDNLVYFYRNQPDSRTGLLQWGTRTPLSRQDSLPPVPSAGTSTQTADINFDKRTDIIRSIPYGGSFAYEIWFNLPNGHYSKSVLARPNPAYNLA